MGEARRRRLRLGQPIEYIDIVTGEKKLARNAGDPIEFIARLRERTVAEQRGERPTADVPCSGCTACCYYHEVDFDPGLERPEDLAHLDTIETDDGRVRLRKREDGACVHLGDTGCMVYAHRPRPCRLYDCRGISLVSMVDTFDGDRHSPIWIFEPRSEKGNLLREAFKMLGMLHQAKGAKDGKTPTAAETYEYALRNVDECYAALEQVSKLPPDQLAKLFGFDPNTVTQEDYIEAMRGMTAGLKTASTP